MKYRLLVTTACVCWIALAIFGSRRQLPFDVSLDASLPQPVSANVAPIPVTDFESFIRALQARGASVRVGAETTQPFFSASGTTVMVNGADVQVFEYPDADAAARDAALVSPDGYTIGATQVDWTDSPHFYGAGRLVVVYVGDDAAALSALERVLGAPFAGGGLFASVSSAPKSLS